MESYETYLQTGCFLWKYKIVGEGREIRLGNPIRFWVDLFDSVKIQWREAPDSYQNVENVIPIQSIDSLCHGARLLPNARPIVTGKFECFFTLSVQSKCHIFRAATKEVLRLWVEGLNRAIFDGGRPPSHSMLAQLFYFAESPDPNSRAIAVLLRDGVPPNVRDSYGRTALMAASRSGNVEVIKLLLGSGADVNVRSPVGDVSLLLATEFRHVDCVRVLLQARKVKVDRRGEDTRGTTRVAMGEEPSSFTALHIAAGLSTSVTSPNEKKEKDKYSEYSENEKVGEKTSCTAGIDIISLLLEAGADVNLIDAKGMTCLHHACTPDASSAHVAILLDVSPDLIDWPDHEGSTPLHIAAKSNNIMSLKALLQTAANPHIQNVEGETCLDIANRLNFHECAEVIQEYCNGGQIEHEEKSENVKEEQNYNYEDQGYYDEAGNWHWHTEYRNEETKYNVKGDGISSSSKHSIGGTDDDSMSSSSSSSGGLEEWVTYFTKEGYPYYYNVCTGISQWEDPNGDVADIRYNKDTTTYTSNSASEGGGMTSAKHSEEMEENFSLADISFVQNCINLEQLGFYWKVTEKSNRVGCPFLNTVSKLCSAIDRLHSLGVYSLNDTIQSSVLDPPTLPCYFVSIPMNAQNVLLMCELSESSPLPGVISDATGSTPFSNGLDLCVKVTAKEEEIESFSEEDRKYWNSCFRSHLETVLAPLISSFELQEDNTLNRENAETIDKTESMKRTAVPKNIDTSVGVTGPFSSEFMPLSPKNPCSPESIKKREELAQIEADERFARKLQQQLSPSSQAAAAAGARSPVTRASRAAERRSPTIGGMRRKIPTTPPPRTRPPGFKHRTRLSKSKSPNASSTTRTWPISPASGAVPRTNSRTKLSTSISPLSQQRKNSSMKVKITKHKRERKKSKSQSPKGKSKGKGDKVILEYVDRSLLKPAPPTSPRPLALDGSNPSTPTGSVGAISPRHRNEILRVSPRAKSVSPKLAVAQPISPLNSLDAPQFIKNNNYIRERREQRKRRRKKAKKKKKAAKGK
eukprot:g710.t1